MNVKRNDWFVTPVWEVKTNFDETFNNQLILDINNYYNESNANKTDSNIWSSNKQSINYLNKTILDYVRKLTYEYVSVNYDGDFDYYHTRGWLNYHKPGQHLPIHGHGGSKLTITYYVNAPENCGDLLMIDPRGGVDWDKGMDGINGTKFNRIKPEAGKLVIFPSYILHTVEENKSNEPRISITSDISTLSSASIRDFVKGLNNVL